MQECCLLCTPTHTKLHSGGVAPSSGEGPPQSCLVVPGSKQGRQVGKMWEKIKKDRCVPEAPLSSFKLR